MFFKPSVMNNRGDRPWRARSHCGSYTICEYTFFGKEEVLPYWQVYFRGNSLAPLTPGQSMSTAVKLAEAHNKKEVFNVHEYDISGSLIDGEGVEEIGYSDL